MEGAYLGLAQMEGAILNEAKMDRSTYLTDASLRGASVRAVDWSSVAILPDQVNAMFGDGSVILPPGMPWPAHWPRHKLNGQDFDTQYTLWRKNPAGYTPPPPP
jgi:hypothetical protein